MDLPKNVVSNNVDLTSQDAYMVHVTGPPEQLLLLVHQFKTHGHIQLVTQMNAIIINQSDMLYWYTR